MHARDRTVTWVPERRWASWTVGKPRLYSLVNLNLWKCRELSTTRSAKRWGTGWEWKTDDLAMIQYLVYSETGVCSTRWKYYLIHAVLVVCSTQCMQHLVYAVAGVCSTRCMLHSVLCYVHGVQR